MGTPQPQTPPVDEGTTPASAPVGHRVAAARARRKRTLVLASAAGLTLLVGGTATAAALTAAGQPQDAVNATVVPEADPDPLPVGDTPTGPDEDARQRAADAVAAATRTGTSQASDIAEQPSPEPDTPADDPGGSGGGGGGEESTGQSGTCQASYYGADFAGRTTANGETFDPSAMTAAHKTLPFNTQVKVTNPNNGKSVTVRINDRGPYVDGRCLDLSTAAFDQIIGTGAGVGQVQWQVLG
ncbi:MULTISPECIES: septal ring lytic transglycosylase RlpA family protein [unclassified Nocardiopsis]|uniref:septal ring lytic transglycosylase RlpA family protein n=1 Tax=unclassified Nocardiopsis TaxID=2649073 RepID=UPI00272E41CB|nr:MULTISPECIES: septal ring lytic transglycosylase RlpA family protein [unclassified Nocardiopsis]